MDKNLETLDLDVIGMECINCANSIKTYLEKTDGVSNVNINFSSEIANISFNPEKIQITEIKSIIKKLGYDVAEEDEEDKLEEQKKKSLKIQRIKIVTSIIFTILIMGITMSGHYKWLSFLSFSMNVSFIILFIISSIVVFWCGDKFLKGAVNAFKAKTATMDTTISLGTLSSYIYSIIISINHLFGLNISALSHSHETYYETAAMIISFILIGNYLEAVLKSKTQTSIKKLKALQSKFVTVIRDGIEIQIPFKKVKINDIVIIKSGERIPVDGEIAEGYCIVDESAMTGESLPVEKIAGNILTSGTVVLNGVVKMKATKVGKDTMLSKIITLVKEASNSKPKIQRLADKISMIFVPSVIIIAVLTFIIWNFVIGEAFDKSLLYSVSVLIIACPCALGLASPMAVVIGIGRAAENGILFNNVEAIEKLNKIDTLCFDKTGTLTTGKMALKSIHSLNNFDKDELMKYVASLEKYSNHPIANSINHYIKENNITLFENVTDIENEDGMGIKGIVNNKNIVIGNERMMNFYKIETKNSLNEKNILLIGINGELAGKIEFEDTLKPESKEAVVSLKSKGIDLFMISGDNKITASKVAESVGITNFSYMTLPDEKEKIITELQQNGKIVAMVGDGINDAPSLAKSNVGIAVGTGQDIAIDSADAILVKGDLRNISKAINISGKTVSVIKQNIFWAFFYNILAIPLAAGVLSPYGIYISPVMAAMLMAFSDVVTVIGNSLRLKFVNINN